MKTNLGEDLALKVAALRNPIECKTCLFDSSVVKIMEDGECEMCKLHWQQKKTELEPWEDVLNRIRKKGKGRKYDCLVGISGGEDSSVLLYLAVKVWKLRVLVLHINNRMNTVEANNNIRVLRDNLNVNVIEYFPAKQEYEELTDAMLKAGVQDADLANDVIMAKLTFKFAKDNKIKCTLNGHSFREEGSSPRAWSFLDTTYLLDIYKRFNNKDLYYYDVLTLWDQIHSALIGMMRVSPYHYGDHDRASIISKLKAWGWKDYGGKHMEHIYTAWIGCDLLPNKFGIDKRKTYYGAQIREGKITKEEAKERLKIKPKFDLNLLGDRKDHILRLANFSPIRPRSEYKQTNYKKLRYIFWVLAKFGIVPISMYRKYCV